MDKRQRIAMQRAKTQEAIGLLKAVSEMFGTEDDAWAGESDDAMKWQMEVSDFETWVFQSSPLA